MNPFFESIFLLIEMVWKEKDAILYSMRLHANRIAFKDAHEHNAHLQPLFLFLNLFNRSLVCAKRKNQIAYLWKCKIIDNFLFVLCFVRIRAILSSNYSDYIYDKWNWFALYSPYSLACPFLQSVGRTFLAIRRVLVQF